MLKYPKSRIKEVGLRIKRVTQQGELTFKTRIPSINRLILGQINQSDISINLINERGDGGAFKNENVRIRMAMPNDNETFEELNLKLFFKNPELISQTAVRFV